MSLFSHLNVGLKSAKLLLVSVEVSLLLVEVVVVEVVVVSTKIGLGGGGGALVGMKGNGGDRMLSSIKSMDKNIKPIIGFLQHHLSI